MKPNFVDLTPLSPLGVKIVPILCNVAEGVFEIALVIAVIAILVGAFYYLTSGGSEQRISRGKQAITYAVFGVIVAILAWGAALIIASTLGTGTTITNPC